MTRVLLVEDDAAIREITTLALEAAGHEVRASGSAPEALRIATSEPIDVILLDVRMPIMDGAEFARQYRSRAPRPAPIIVLTAARDATLGREVFAASRYIEKPFDLDDLLNAITEVAGGTP